MKLAYLYVAIGLIANLATIHAMNRTYDGWARGAPTWSWGMLLNYAGVAVPIVVTQFCLILAKSEMSLTGAIATLISAVLIGSLLMESYAAGRAPTARQWALAAVMVASVWAFLLAGAPEVQASRAPAEASSVDGAQ
ncbi:MAG: hypothetical protein CMJ58_13475 [Planctomycetaceae bacterium]|nr:hypothetical protein [Planctomycetaceae bacterium]